MKQYIVSLACLAMIAGVTGCASPRLVSSNPNTVVVAVADQTNDWPFHYRDEAYKTAKQFLSDPVLVSTNRVKVGETVTNTQNTDRRDIANSKKKLGELTMTTNNTTVKDEFEYYLEFQNRPASAGRSVLSPNGQIQQTGAVSP